MHQSTVPVPSNVVVLGNKVQIHMQGVVFSGSNIDISCTSIMGKNTLPSSLTLEGMVRKPTTLPML